MTWLDDSSRDLIASAFDAPAERAWVPASRGLLVAGKRHLIAAEAKSGKSLATLTHALDIVLAGGTVAILDRENGLDESRRRMRDLATSRGIGRGDAAALDVRLIYAEWPAPKMTDVVEALAGCDLVVLDSSRAFLSHFGFDENVSDDVARFMAGVMDPLHRAGVATLVLDNTGHEESRRPRGSSSKLDLFDVVMTMRTLEPFNRTRRGKVLVARERSRIAEVGDSWTMVLGGGQYGSWTPTARQRDAVLEAVLAFVLEHAPVSTVNVRAGVTGKAATVSAALQELADEGEIVRGEDGWRPCPTDGTGRDRPPLFVDRPNPESTPVPRRGLGTKSPPDGTGSTDGGNGDGNLSLSRDREQEDRGSEPTSFSNGSSPSTPEDPNGIVEQTTIDEMIAAVETEVTVDELDATDENLEAHELEHGPPDHLDDWADGDWLAAFPGSSFDEGVER